MYDYFSPIERESTDLIDTIDGDPLLGRVIRGEATRDEYVRYLAATYHYVRWSGPLLAETAEGLRRRGGYSWLVETVDDKTREEAPHDWWALADLARCGENVELVKATDTPMAVQAYVGWSRAMAQAGSPAFLGAAYALEVMSMHRAKRAAENLRARGEIPHIDHAVSFLSGHGDADADHVARLAHLLRRIDDAADQAAIRLSAAVLGALYPRFFDVQPGSARLRSAA